jgi:hypothetical protein
VAKPVKKVSRRTPVAGGIGRFGGVGAVTKRLRGSKIIYDNRDNLARAMLSMVSANITDVVDIDNGSMRLKDVKKIPDHALAAIKKIRISPSQHGDIVDVEMIDKVRLYQMLAKSAGLLDSEKVEDTPAVVDIQMVMPDEEGGTG